MHYLIEINGRKEAQKTQKGFDVKQEHSLNVYDDDCIERSMLLTGI
jgi:hypothetical protein